jgi:hypothetical protein
LIFFATFSLIFLSIKTALLRSSGITKDRCYSLGRVQLAWWSYIIIISFLVLFGVTGEFSDILTTQSLILLGIGTGTTFISSFIDSGKADNKVPLDYDDRINIQNLENNIKDLEEKISKKKTSWQLIKQEVIDYKKKLNRYELQSTGNIWKDILTDTNGDPNIHRAQIIIWSVILGLIFIYEVIVDFKFPEFDETLLTLQGISSATFLGLKAQSEEKKEHPPQEPEGQPPTPPQEPEGQLPILPAETQQQPENFGSQVAGQDPDA